MTKFLKYILSLAVITVTSFIFSLTGFAADDVYAGRVQTQSGNLNVRSGASSTALVITSIKNSGWVTLLEKEGKWWRVEYADGKYGWCHSDYIKVYTESYPITVNITSGYLNVRKGAGTDFEVKSKLYKGEEAVVIKDKGQFSQILYGGNKTGYAASSYLKRKISRYPEISLPVVSFKQTDSRWASYPIGTTGGTIGTIGCTTTALAMTESYHTGTTITPEDMVKRLTYSASGSLYWPSTYSVELASSDYLARIYSLLKQGKAVVFGAKKSGGTQHWVTVTGYKGSSDKLSASGFTVNDPGSKVRATIADFMAAYPNEYKIVYRK